MPFYSLYYIFRVEILNITISGTLTHTHIKRTDKLMHIYSNTYESWERDSCNSDKKI